MSPVCRARAAYGVPPQATRTRSAGSSQDAAIAQTSPTARAFHPERTGHRPGARIDDEVVGVAHNDHIARGLALSPAHGPDLVSARVALEARPPSRCASP